MHTSHHAYLLAHIEFYLFRGGYYPESGQRIRGAGSGRRCCVHLIDLVLVLLVDLSRCSQVNRAVLSILQSELGGMWRSIYLGLQQLHSTFLIHGLEECLRL